MRSFGAALLVALPICLAQGPGGNQVGPGVVSSSGDVMSDTYEATSTSALPKASTGPWSDLEHLEGTWSSKSQMVMTGPDFYDPVDELLIEPALPGISYSFTKDGYWEEALYQVTSNPSDPSCPAAALTFQHGTYNITSSGKLELTPISVDGRQLVSQPCNGSESTYSKYSQKEQFSQFSIQLDMYYGRYRLNLYQFDGTPVAPLYLVYRPPQMLPTATLNPVGTTATGTGGSTATSQGKSKRSVRERVQHSLANRAKVGNAHIEKDPMYNKLWWAGVSMMAAGTVGWIALS